MAQAQLPVFSITYGDLCRQLASTASTVQWCRQKKLLPSQHTCLCGAECRVVRRKRYPEGECFRCPRKGCQKVVSFRTGTFLKLKSAIGRDCPTYLLVVDNHPTAQNGEGVRGGFNVHKFSMSISIYVWRNNLHTCIVLIADITTHCCGLV